MRLTFSVLALFLLAVTAQAADKAAPAAATIKEGVHYQKLPTEQRAAGGDTIEVMEFFSYACPHCADFAPYITRWEENKPANAKLVLVPVIFRNDWVNYAKAYYALELLKAVDKGHLAIFEAIHVKKKTGNSPEQLADIVAAAGVDRQKFLDAMNSFAVDNFIRQSMQMAQEYKVTGVPAVAVEGKYMTGASMAGGYEGVLDVVDYLVALESKPVKKTTAAK